LVPAVVIIQHTSLFAGILIGVILLLTTVVLAAVRANQKTVVPVPHVPPVPYFKVGIVSAEVAAATEVPNSMSVM
jgi:hypothetical protein